ncbi:hypothetical protein BDW59DRAFT_116385 [Aspergillus cavernicola]|uniref:Ferritin-like domain-containing protein n=1 Tax=Aspergillus cavernicola TaxID=176166 RepID=A0ABR4HY92_9EURO
MRILSTLSALLLSGAALAQNTTCSASSSDAEVVRYASALQSLTARFYASQPVNQTFLSDATNSSRVSYYQNIQGIQRDTRLGVRAVQQLGSRVSGFSNPSCNFTFPNATNGEGYVRNALQLESNVASALLGATGYTQSPEVAFLLSRLAAQHIANGIWLATQQTSVLFLSNSSSLLPAYNPSYVIASGDQPGRLGQYLQGCVQAPSNPCGQPFFIGPLIGSVGNSSSATAGSNSASISPTAAARRF